jgi:hypothetical protein
VSVDTNTVNKNLAPYERVRHPDFRVLVSPVLSGMVSRMRITTKGKLVKSLTVELADGRPGSPEGGSGACC